jgi:zinc ribbon protein
MVLKAIHGEVTMFCPSCGNKITSDQKFCRSCGLGLEKIVQSVGEQLPNKLSEDLQRHAAKLEQIGVAALSVFGLAVLSFIGYGIFYKLMITQGRIMAGLGALTAIIVLGCGLLSVILFARANEMKKASDKRRLNERPAELDSNSEARELAEGVPQPIFSVSEPTTELLFAEKQDRSSRQS